MAKSIRSNIGFIFGAVLCGAVGLTAAARAQSVQTDYDHTASFGQYHTFSFYKVQTPDPLFVDRIRDEITKDLSAKGLQMVESGGDLTVTAIETTKDTQEYNTFYDGLGGAGFGWSGWRGWGGGWGGGIGDASTTVTNVPVGTLLVDLYDGKTHQLVWRGTSHEDLSSNPAKNTSTLDKAVNKMFDKYPPKQT
jgi:Domain of unknown function (DUF4136)